MAAEDAEVPALSEAPTPPPALSDGSRPNGEKGKTDDAPEEEEEEAETWEAKRQKTTLSVEVQWLDFEHFKNRYSEKEGLAIIEVLVGHSQIAQEVSREMSKRSRGRKDIRTPTPIPKLAVDGDSYWMHRIRIQSPQLILLLSRLTGHREKFNTERPRTFFAPFRAFHYYLPQMKQGVKALRAKWPVDKAKEPSAPPESPTSQTEEESKAKSERPDGLDARHDVDDGASDVASNADLDDAAPDLSGDVLDSPLALAHLETFVGFIETHIEPAWQRAAGISQRKFRFVDLCMAFQSGELLYAPLTYDSLHSSETGKGASGKAETGQKPGIRADIGQKSSTKMYQKGWRLYAMCQDPINDDKLNDTQKASKRVFHAHVYYMEYDGNSYVPVRHTFNIMDYEGERDITTLEVYPMRFAKDADKIKKELEGQGIWFREAVARNHFSYDGWTLTHSPIGDASDSINPPALEHIDSDVIIDFVEGYKSESSLAGLGPSSWSQGLTDFDDSDWPVGDDAVFIWHWEPAPNSKKVQTFAVIREVMQLGEWYCQRFAEEQQNIRASLKAHADEKPIHHLEGDELLLLPRRVVGYAFRERRFVMLDINSLREPPASDNVFQNLKIDEAHKLMVTSLVESHLDKQKTQKLRPGASLNQDLIRGKGSGLVMLLHGVPGVGKTATAEAVAQANKKPLFVITCGDLGFTPGEVESSLKDIFRLAHSWDCILLLDEADIFLSRRQLSDLKRNALVSVFLRVLEYYSGILFLTTNRVGTLDEAFKSRIHISLYYPPLNKQQTLDIFEVNLNKLQQIVDEKYKWQAELEPDAPKPSRLVIAHESILDYAAWHYDVHEETPDQRWNGRQIRNAFQIAHSLAQFDMRSTPLCQRADGQRPLVGERNRQDRGTPRPLAGDGQLDWRQFNMVAEAIEKFEDYLYSATGNSGRDSAFKEGIREDDYDPRNAQQTPDYIPARAMYQTPRQRAPLPRRPAQHAAPNPNGNYPRQAPDSERAPYRPPFRAEYHAPPQHQQQQQTPVRRPARPPQPQPQPNNPINQRQLTVPANGPPPRRGPNAGAPQTRAPGGPGRGRAGPGGASPLSPSPSAISIGGGPSPQYTHSNKPFQQQQQPPARGGSMGGNKPPPMQRNHDSGYSGWSTGTGGAGPRTPELEHEHEHEDGLGHGHDGGEGEGQEWPGEGEGHGHDDGGGGGDMYAGEEDGLYDPRYQGEDGEDGEGREYDDDGVGHERGEEGYFEGAGRYGYRDEGVAAGY